MLGRVRLRLGKFGLKRLIERIDLCTLLLRGRRTCSCELALHPGNLLIDTDHDTVLGFELDQQLDTPVFQIRQLTLQAIDRERRRHR